MSFKPRYQIRILSEPNSGIAVPLAYPNLKIGRSHQTNDKPQNWLFLEDNTVSRLHAELQWDEEENTFRLLHRSQTNPTFVNDKQVDNVLLAVGDLIKVGRTALSVEALVGEESLTKTVNQMMPEYRLEGTDGSSLLTLDDTEIDWDFQESSYNFRWEPTLDTYLIKRPAATRADVYVSRVLDGATWSTSLRSDQSIPLRPGDKLRIDGQRMVFVRTSSPDDATIADT